MFAQRRSTTVLLLALILPSFRLVAIAYGLWTAPPGSFVPLLGDSWGGAQVIQQVCSGRVFPMGDPTNASASLFIYPPGYFVAVASLSKVAGLSVPFAIQLMGLFIDTAMALALYLIARRFLDSSASKYSVLLLVLPGSLVWVRILPLVMDVGTVSSIISGIASGSTKLAIPGPVKDQITQILYGSHGVLFDGMKMSYEWLAHSFGLLSLLFFFSWMRTRSWLKLATSGIMLGMVNLTHPYALFGWDLLFLSGLIISMLRRRSAETKGVFAVLLMAFVISSFFTVPVTISLFLGGDAGDTLSAVSGGLPWGIYNLFGKVRFPNPIQLFEVQGIGFILSLLAMIILVKRKSLTLMWLPVGFFLLGFILSPLMIAFGIKNQILARQEAFLFMGIALLGGWLLSQITSGTDNLPRLRGPARILPKVFLVLLIFLMITPKAIGFASYTLRWIPKKDILDRDSHNLIGWLGHLSPAVVYAEKDLSIRLGALTGHIVPTGFISTYTTRNWEDIQRTLGNENFVFQKHHEDSLVISVLKEERTEILIADKSLDDCKQRIFFSSMRLIFAMGKYHIYEKRNASNRFKAIM